LLKQDKGRGIVILDKNKYTAKCLNLLQSDQFVKLKKDPTKTIETKIQKAVRKIKSKLTPLQYQSVYPSGSQPGRFYGTAKIHKLREGDNVNQLPLRPIISNVNTASYHLAKYLAKLLSPLSKSEYTVKSTNDFIHKLRQQEIPRDMKTDIFRRDCTFHKRSVTLYN